MKCTDGWAQRAHCRGSSASVSTCKGLWAADLLRMTMQLYEGVNYTARWMMQIVRCQSHPSPIQLSSHQLVEEAGC